MRISTAQIYDAGIGGVINNQSALFKTQNQLSSGTRVLTPADDPVASARALVVTQSLEVNKRYMENQTAASSTMALVEGYTQSTVNLIQNVRERLVQAGSTSLTNSDRQAIATELESRLQELVGLANSQDGTGQYLFSGYKGSTTPFAKDVNGNVAYYGDSGERLLQVEATRFMPVSVAGDDLFMNSRKGNGTFEALAGGNLTAAFANNGINKGTATVSAGSVSDPGKWGVTTNPGNFMVRFSVATAADGTKTTTYRLYDNRNPGAPVELTPPAPAAGQPYVPGAPIQLADTTAGLPPVADYGASIMIQGAPADGDSFTVAPSGSQSLFATLENAIKALKTPIGGSSYSSTQFVNDLAAQLTNLDQNLDNVSRVQAKLGARMNEVDALKSTSEDVNLQYKTTISGLVDLDYAKAISDFAKQQTQLEAAQASYAKIMQLGLFNYL